jgi:TetR/AcrR family transcriptional regulator, transcriptional repressor of bet genes
MVRLKIRDYRRNELIQATIDTIAAKGLADITLADIAAHAGMSPALVSHYFDGKNELLEATLRSLAKAIAQSILIRFKADPSPLSRMHAIIDACFEAEHFRPGAMVAWTASWLYMQTNPRLAEVQRVINRRYRSNMLFALKQLMPEPIAKDIATTLFATIDGFWLREAIDRGAVSPNDARRLCRSYLTLALQAATRASRQKPTAKRAKPGQRRPRSAK